LLAVELVHWTKQTSVQQYRSGDVGICRNESFGLGLEAMIKLQHKCFVFWEFNLLRDQKYLLPSFNREDCQNVQALKSSDSHLSVWPF
jgi:hypothetical protein